jgi:hypothetical protein
VLLQILVNDLQPRQRVVELQQALAGEAGDGQDLGQPVADPGRVVEAVGLGEGRCRCRR